MVIIHFSNIIYTMTNITTTETGLAISPTMLTMVVTSLDEGLIRQSSFYSLGLSAIFVFSIMNRWYLRNKYKRFLKRQCCTTAGSRGNSHNAIAKETFSGQRGPGTLGSTTQHAENHLHLLTGTTAPLCCWLLSCPDCWATMSGI